MDELGCPRCRTTKYNKPSMRLMINIWGHALCEACVDQLFVRESGTCPECNAPLRKSGFRIQLFEDTAVDKEVDVRKQMMKIFNKQEADFTSLREYNDYLEEVELIIESLLSGTNVDSTKVKIARYKNENESLIKKNQARINRERAFVMDQMEKERKQNELKRKIRDEMEKEQNETKRRKQQELLDDLEKNRHMSAQQVLAMHEQRAEVDTSTPTFEERLVMSQNELADISSGDAITGFGGCDELLLGASSRKGSPYVYHFVEEDILGPPMPSKDNIVSVGYLNNVRQSTDRDIGGGYSSLTACSRALQDAFTGLLWRPCATIDAII